MESRNSSVDFPKFDYKYSNTAQSEDKKIKPISSCMTRDKNAIRTMERGLNGIPSTAATCLQRSGRQTRAMGAAKIDNTPWSAQLMVAGPSNAPVHLGAPTDEC